MESPPSQSASNLIQLRSSWRSCTGQAIPPDELKQLDEYIRSKAEGIFGEKVRFELNEARAGDS